MRFGDLEIKLPDEGRMGFRFAYDSNELARVCRARAAENREREQFYIAQADSLEKQVREKGVELREQQVTGGPRFAAVVDPELSNQLMVARAKRDAHQGEAELFEAYAGAFDSVRTEYVLTIDDVMYFGMHRKSA